jgi:CheY-like chemotaxis protein
MTADRNHSITKERDMDTVKQAQAHNDTAGTSLTTNAVPQLLVIDDDPTHRVVISRLAQKLGYVTTDAGTVAEAAELIAGRQFDCITLDLHMGAQHGSDLFDVMSANQPDVPVIVVSSADDEERWNVLRVATLYGVRVTEVPKPLEVERLRAAFAEIGDMG